MAKKQQQTEELSGLKKALASLEKDYGKGVVVGSSTIPNYTDIIPTGSIGLDWATGIGGLPLGKIVEIISWESAGKSTLSLHLIAEAQKKGYTPLLVDGENSFDEKYAKAIGVDIDKLLITQLGAGGGEQAYNVAERLIESGEINLVIFDSQNSLQPKKVLDDGVDSSNLGLHARMLGRVCVQLNRLSDKYNCLCVFLSQYREKIGVLFGSPLTGQGGNALKYYAHMRIELSKSVLKEGEEAYANKTRVKIIKNKLARPFKTAEFNINFGEGIDKIDEIIKLGTQTGVLKKWGNQVKIMEGDRELSKWELQEFKNELMAPPVDGVIPLYPTLKKNIIELLSQSETPTKSEEENEE